MLISKSNDQTASLLFSRLLYCASFCCRYLCTASAAASSWSSAIRSATQLGRFRHALSLYAQMQISGHLPDPFAVSAALKSASRLSSTPHVGASIHAHAHKLGHGRHVYTHTALVDLYSKLHGPDSARKMFDEIKASKNVVTWNSILSAYLRAGDLESAQNLFGEMPLKDVVSWNTMVSGYAKAHQMEAAALIFEQMPVKNTASWNAMISGHIDNNDMDLAREMFNQMVEKSNVSWILIISGYSRHGDVTSAYEIFEQMQERDIFSWNAIIACYAQNGRPREALRLFSWMQKLNLNVIPDEMTFTSIISACSQLGELRYGLWIEKHMSSLAIELDDRLRTSLINLFAKCGGMDRAFELFDSLRKKDVVSYSAMIFGCGINGKYANAIYLYKQMLKDKIAPNEVTYTGILTAYNHAGLVDEAKRCFAYMWSDHGVSPSVDHFAIMVDLLGRSGCLEEAYGLIGQMPVMPHIGVWGALLLACRLHGNVELGEIAADRCFELEPGSSGYYVLLANIYAQAGKWDKARQLRKLMLEKGLNKTPGWSWVEPGYYIH